MAFPESYWASFYHTSSAFQSDSDPFSNLFSHYPVPFFFAGLPFPRISLSTHRQQRSSPRVSFPPSPSSPHDVSTGFPMRNVFPHVCLLFRTPPLSDRTPSKEIFPSERQCSSFFRFGGFSLCGTQLSCSAAFLSLPREEYLFLKVITAPPPHRPWTLAE